MNEIYGGAITDIFKQLLGIIDKGLAELSKYGIKVQDKEVKETKDGQEIRYRVFMGNDDAEVFVQVIHNNETKKCTVVVVDKKGHKMTKKGVKPRSVDEIIRKFGIKYYDTDSFVKESKRFKVTLQKIASSKETSIELTNVFCNSIPGDEIYEVVSDAVESDEFADMITEDPVSFEFIDEGQGYQFTETDLIEDTAEVGIDESCIVDILASLYSLYNTSMICSFSSCGNNMIDLKEISNNLRSTVQWHIESLYEMWSMQSDVMQPFDIMKQIIMNEDTQDVITFEIGCQMLATHLSSYISKLQCYFCLVPVEYQILWGEWIRSCKSELLNLERSNYVERS